MASTSFFFFLLAVSIVAIYGGGLASATDYVVGDEHGWTTYVDYQAWAKGKQFVVGDKLIFKYVVGANNVYKVDGSAFKQCAIPPMSQPLTTGNDVVELAAPGRKWYISGVGESCQKGQKLVITVGAPAPAPTPSCPRKLFYPTPTPSPVAVPAPAPATPYWPWPIISTPAAAPAPATPYWPWPIKFSPAASPAPAPATPYWPWPIKFTPAPAPAPETAADGSWTFPPIFPPTLPIVLPPIEITPAPEPYNGY